MRIKNIVCIFAAAIAAFFIGTTLAAGTPQPVSQPVSQPASQPYAGQQDRAIKSFSDKEIEDLQLGRGMGLSKVAELNRYPGPRHSIDMAQKLKLSPEQLQFAQKEFDRMDAEAKHLGTSILEKERALDMFFAHGYAASEQVHELIAEIARLQGELRFVHLNAHMAMKSVLSNEQVAAYDAERGYGSADTRSNAHVHH